MLQLLEERLALLGEGRALGAFGIQLIKRQSHDVDDNNVDRDDGREQTEGQAA